MIKDTLPITDNVTLTFRDNEGKVIKKETTHNILTIPGQMFFDDIVRARANVNPVTITQAYVAVGTGSVANNYWLGSLTTEVSGAGNPGRDTPSSVSRSNQVVLISTYYDTTEASGNLSEVGLFTKGYDSGGNLLTVSAAKNSGVLVAYATFNASTKDNTNTLTIDWEINV